MNADQIGGAVLAVICLLAAAQFYVLDRWGKGE